MIITMDESINLFSQYYRKTIALILMFGLLTSCKAPERRQAGEIANSNASQSVSAKSKVVVTHSVLCDLTKQIAAATVEVICLLTPGTDPHIYKLTPGVRQSIEDAKLLMYGGYNFEPDLIKAIKGSSNPAPKVAVDEVAVPQPQQFVADGKSTADPHVWHNAQNGIKIVETISARLETLLPERAATYQKNTKKLTAEIAQIDTWIKSQINTIPAEKRILFTTHDSLGYYAKAYGIPVAALEGLSTESKPTASRIKELVEKIKQAKISTIYAELSINPQLIKTIAQEAKVQVSKQAIYADGLGEVDSPGGNYQQMLISNTKAIVEGLGGKYTAFVAK
jgi:manganese/iron transport system substrate-binding protein